MTNSWQPLVSSLNDSEYAELVAAVAHRAVERPAPEKPLVGNESSGGDTRLMKGGKDRPNHRGAKR